MKKYIEDSSTGKLLKNVYVLKTRNYRFNVLTDVNSLPKYFKTAEDQDTKEDLYEMFKEQGEVLLLRFANDLEECGKVESMPSLEGKKMFLYLAPKKAGAQKKSQQARDREAAEAEAKEAAKLQREQETEEAESRPISERLQDSQNSGLFANAKISADALKKLQEAKD